MKVSIISFTKKGYMLSEKIKILLNFHEVSIHRSGKNNLNVKEWTENNFIISEALIFIGATGIAVRAITPYIKSKTSDPAVIVVDELGKFAIPILSGHIGGANTLSNEISSLLKSTLVLTTATDINNLFAIDVWAKKNNLKILNPEKICNVSSKILEGENIKIYSDFIMPPLPNYIIEAKENYDVYISVYKSKNNFPLFLVPPILVLGIGCKKGTPSEHIEKCFIKFCNKENIEKKSIKIVSSIDLKTNELGLVEFCNKYNFLFRCFSSEQLMEIEGNFTESKFVKSITNTDNVCERSAVKASEGKLLIKKTIIESVTFALAIKNYYLKE